MALSLSKIKPARLLLLGYASYMIIGWILLSLPFSQKTSINAIDNLFISVSAISTTGLVTISPNEAYSFFGVLVILFLIQIGGIGYMTFGSFIVLSSTKKLSQLQENMCHQNFALPDKFSMKEFIKSVIFFTFAIELIGCFCLFLVFGQREGYTLNVLFSSLFHSVSAFCTAGFSLYSNSFEGYRDNIALNFIIILLSYMGAIGFIVWVDFWRYISKKTENITFTSKIILHTTLLFSVLGTLIIFTIEPSIKGLEPHLRLNAAFFQVMTATTTVGFNSIPFSNISLASVILIFFFMIFGASPSGTGGGLKSTTFSALIGLMRSTLKNRDGIRYMKRTIPTERLQAATAAFIYFFFACGIACFLLSLTENSPFEHILFESLSAMGTVGVSLGITSQLSPLGKIIIMILMTMGRVGILTFGIAVSSADESLKEIQQNDLVI